MRTFDWIRRFVRRPATVMRPDYDGESWDYGRWGCPDCGYDKFYSGPSGGMNTNICCANPLCRSAFNTCFSLDYVQRISNRWFRGAFKECPEESEAYMRAELRKALDKETEEAMKRLEGQQ